MTQRKAAYWTSTGFAALARGATGLADLLRLPAMESLRHLGYSAVMTYALPCPEAKESSS